MLGKPAAYHCRISRFLQSSFRPHWLASYIIIGLQTICRLDSTPRLVLPCFADGSCDSYGHKVIPPFGSLGSNGPRSELKPLSAACQQIFTLRVHLPSIGQAGNIYATVRCPLILEGHGRRYSFSSRPYRAALRNMAPVPSCVPDSCLDLHLL